MKDSTLRIIYGFSLLLVLASLGIVIALGKVEEKTSYGLNFILGALTGLSGQFAQWAFNGNKDSDK